MYLQPFNALGSSFLCYHLQALENEDMDTFGGIITPGAKIYGEHNRSFHEPGHKLRVLPAPPTFLSNPSRRVSCRTATQRRNPRCRRVEVTHGQHPRASSSLCAAVLEVLVLLQGAAPASAGVLSFFWDPAWRQSTVRLQGGTEPVCTSLPVSM